MSMFTHTLDDKPVIRDDKGNLLVDLAASYFARSAGTISNYRAKKMTSYYEMRPDLVALAEYDDTDYTEVVLKFTGVSNPFALEENDIMIFPRIEEAQSMLRVNNPQDDPDQSAREEVLIQNFYKYINTDYKRDFSSYYAIENLHIPSGILKREDIPNYKIPYISEEGEAVMVKNGRLYFGENAGLMTTAQLDAETLSTSSIDDAIRGIVNSTISRLDAQCLYNGTSVAEFQAANYANNN